MQGSFAVSKAVVNDLLPMTGGGRDERKQVEEARAGALGKIGAATGAGMMLGPGLGMLLVRVDK
eukprot:SAG31_NODE_4098_length_3588_cov_2.607624_3_plen_64_part_00